jgi:hypothetical protein
VVVSAAHVRCSAAAAIFRRGARAALKEAAASVRSGAAGRADRRARPRHASVRAAVASARAGRDRSAAARPAVAACFVRAAHAAIDRVAAPVACRAAARVLICAAPRRARVHAAALAGDAAAAAGRRRGAGPALNDVPASVADRSAVRMGGSTGDERADPRVGFTRSIA